MKEFILGLDPGSRHTGFGVIASDGDHFTHVAHGVIHLKGSAPLQDRLVVLHSELALLFGKFEIHDVAIEQVFFGKNADSAFKLGHARGVCLLAAAQSGAVVAEYAARYVKKSLTGSGAADKSQVQTMVCNLLRIKTGELAFDASDALSLAVTHARVRDGHARLRQMTKDAEL